MSRSFHILDDLPWPFRLVDERVISVPAGASLITRNEDFKLIAFYEGRFCMEIDGAGSFAVQPGDFVVIPSPCIQKYFPEKPSAESRLHVFRLMFDPSLASGKVRSKIKVDASLVNVLHRIFPGVRYFSGGLKGDVGRLLAKILEEIDAESIGYREAVNGLLLQLVASLLRLAEKEDASHEGEGAIRADQIVSYARAWLVDNFDRPVKLADIAWHLRISEEHLSRIFQQRTGGTVLNTIRELRISKARRLLLGGNESLSSIARSCGFRSLAVFSVNFKKLTSLSPGAYRRMHSAKIVFRKSDLHWNTQDIP